MNHLARASVEMCARGAVTPIEKKRLGCVCWLALSVSATSLLMFRPLEFKQVRVCACMYMQAWSARNTLSKRFRHPTDLKVSRRYARAGGMISQGTCFACWRAQVSRA